MSAQNRYVPIARSLGALIRQHAPAGERQGRLTAPVVDALIEAGLFRLALPHEFGGAEVDPLTFSQVVEEVSSHDGSTGWCAMVGGLGGPIAAHLQPQTASLIFADADAFVVGPISPIGTATPVTGGFRVDGRWPFASGSPYARWIVAGCLSTAPSGNDVWCMAVLPSNEVEILQTWDASGLRATASHDIVIRDTFVPNERAFFVGRRPNVDRPLYHFPLFGLLAVGVAAVSLGIARRAIEEMIRLATSKTPMGMHRSLAYRPTAQIQAAQAEAARAAGRAHLTEALETAWERIESGARLAPDDRARLRLAATNATLSAARAVDLAYSVGGGSSVHMSNPLQRCFRDVHTATQHFSTAPQSLEQIGRVLLGAESDTSFL